MDEDKNNPEYNATSYPLQNLADNERREPSPAYSQYHSSSNLAQPQQAYQQSQQGFHEQASQSNLRNQYDLHLNTNPYEYNPDVENNGEFSPQDPDQQQQAHRTRSMRSFFSSRSKGSGRRSQQGQDDSNNTNGEQDEEKLLPIQESENEYEESLPDINDVVNEMEDEQTGGGSKRRGHTGITRKLKKKRHVPNKAIKAVRGIYTNFMAKSLFTRSLVYWFPLAAILFIPLAVDAWGPSTLEVGGTRIKWLFIWIEIVWAGLWVGRFVAHACPHIYEFLMGVINPQWKSYSTILKAVELPLSYFFWVLISLCTFMPILTQQPGAQVGEQKQRTWQHVVQNILVALLVCSLVYLGERLMIHFLSVSYHKTQFAKRIKDNRLAIKVLTQLLDASYSVFPQNCSEFESDDLHLQAGALANRGKNIPVGFARKIVTSNDVQKVVGNLSRVVGGAAKVLGTVGRDISGNGQDDTSHQVVMDALANRYTSETLARRIWMSLVLEGADELTIGDLVDVLGEQNRSDSEAVFAVLDQDGNGNLTMDEMVASVQGISRERKTIFRSLRDMGSVIGKLHSVLMAVLMIVFIIVFVGMLSPSGTATLATLGTSILGLSFIFGGSAASLLQCCIFVFAKKPMSVNEMVSLNGDDANRMIVVEISLLYTVFQYLATGLITQYPNDVLNTIQISNITRSNAMSYSLSLNLGVPETQLEDLDKLKDRLDTFLEENSRDYYPDPYFQVIDYPDLDQITLCINITFKSNQHDSILFGIRRTRLHQFLAQSVHEIPLHIPRRSETYNNPGLPIIFSQDNQPIEGTEGTDNNQQGDNNNQTKGHFTRSRPTMGFRPPRPPTFEFDGPSTDNDTDKKDGDENTTVLSPVEDSRASGALGRLDSMASQSSALSRKKTFTGMRKR